jgi:hypothetical protein
MSDLPDFRSEQRPHDWSAAQLRNLVNLARKLNNITCGPGLTVQSSPNGLHFALSQQWHKSIPLDATVVVVAHPRIEDVNLTVRKVRYATMPPKESVVDCDEGGRTCTYDWDGGTFEAYPDFGLRVIDYDAYYWSNERPPMLQTPFLKAYHRDGYWRVETAPGIERLCVIRGIGNSDDWYLDVQEVDIDRTSSPWNGQFVPIGEQVTVNVWPETEAEDYRIWLWRGAFYGRPDGETPTVLALTRIGGLWYIKPFPKWNAVVLKPGVRISDCSMTVKKPLGAGGGL